MITYVLEHGSFVDVVTFQKSLKNDLYGSSPSMLVAALPSAVLFHKPRIYSLFLSFFLFWLH